MKKVFFVFTIPLLVCGVALGQVTPNRQPGLIYPGVEGPTPQKAPAFSDPAIQARFAHVSGYMRFSSPLQGGDQTLAGLGDESAFFIFTLMVNGPPMTAAQTLTALDIVHKSFARPVAIQNGQTKPVKSLALLKLLQETAVDQTVKERIAIETNFLNAVPEKIIFPPMGVPGPPPPPGSIPTR